MTQWQIIVVTGRGRLSLAGLVLFSLTLASFFSKPRMNANDGIRNAGTANAMPS